MFTASVASAPNAPFPNVCSTAAFGILRDAVTKRFTTTVRGVELFAENRDVGTRETGSQSRSISEPNNAARVYRSGRCAPTGSLLGPRRRAATAVDDRIDAGSAGRCHLRRPPQPCELLPSWHLRRARVPLQRCTAPRMRECARPSRRKGPPAHPRRLQSLHRCLGGRSSGPTARLTTSAAPGTHPFRPHLRPSHPPGLGERAVGLFAEAIDDNG